MCSFKLLAVAVLAVVMAASMFSLASAQPAPITVYKATTNGDTTTLFHFTFSSGAGGTAFDLTGGSSHGFVVVAGTYIVQETVPSGWALERIDCGWLDAVVAGGGVFAAGSLGVASYRGEQLGSSTFAVNLADHSVTIVLAQGENVACTFTNGPAPVTPVGGFIEPINQLAVVGSYFALAGLIAATAVAAVAIKKRHEN
jgi:hypothetical protein